MRCVIVPTHCNVSPSLTLFRYSTKLRALSDAQIEDFGAKVAVERPVESQPAVDVVRLPSVSYDSPRLSLSDGNDVDRLGLGDFLKEFEARGADSVAREKFAMEQEESAETREMTSEE